MSSGIGTNCITCTRWKLFGEKPCAEHPDFKTDADVRIEEEAEKWRRCEENLDVMMFTAALRTTAAIGRTDLLNNVFANLSMKSEYVQKKVTEEVSRRGLMTAEEMSLSISTVLRVAAGPHAIRRSEDMTKEQAVSLYESKFWEQMTDRDRATFQLIEDRLCMPFDVFHEAVEKALGRPVFTHEFGLNRSGLISELIGDRPAPTISDILNLDS